MEDVLKEGELEWQKKGKIGGKKWKAIIVVLTPGGLHFYKDAHDMYPAKSLNLEGGVTLEGGEKGKPFSFGVKCSDATLLLASDSEAEATQWSEAIKQAAGKKMVLPPKKQQRGKGSIMFRAKKNISGKVATSALMKQKVMNEETRTLLDALVAVVEKVTDAKTAANVEKQIIKMVLKGYFQFEKENITMEDFRKIDGVIRKAFNQVDKLFGYYQVRPTVELKDGFTKTAGMLQEGSTAVMTLLEPHVRPENITKMKEALAVIANADFLFKVWDCPSIEQELLSLITAMNKYTQIELS